jgi:DNA polymerase III alpha subunit (gram-positive type)
MNFDLVIVERELENIKQKIDTVLGNNRSATESNKETTTTPKNEIVNEYFYDSEEEWRIQ